jgi:hypothetical protein
LAGLIAPPPNFDRTGDTEIRRLFNLQQVNAAG